VGDSTYVPPARPSTGGPADDDFNLLEDELAQQQFKVADPLKPLNRAMHNVNDKLYFSVLRPVARACKKAVPKPARISIRNFFNNLTTPARYISCLLQGKRKAAGTELHRFALNTTVGVLGFADPAQEKWKLAPTDEDLGQTLGKWGVGNGVYVVLPLLGPSTVRDTLGLIGGQLLNPVHYVEPTEVSLAISAGKIANENTFTIGRYESFKSAAVDPYTAMRQAYIQYRDKQVKD
jgi:phospholipid-binding lipoprotein MlaA